MVLVIERSLDRAPTVVLVVAVLFGVLLSVVTVDVMVTRLTSGRTVLARVPPLGGDEELTWAWTVNVTVAPAMSAPVHESVVAAVPHTQPPTESTGGIVNVMPAGSVSLTSALEESLGPLLCAVMV